MSKFIDYSRSELEALMDDTRQRITDKPNEAKYHSLYQELEQELKFRGITVKHHTFWYFYKKMLFSLEGRVSTRDFLIYRRYYIATLLSPIILILSLLGLKSLPLISFIVVIILIFLLFVNHVFLVKRMHDLNKSAWRLLPTYVPMFFIGLLVTLQILNILKLNTFWLIIILLLLIMPTLQYIECIFVPGTRGPNRFGEDPNE